MHRLLLPMQPPRTFLFGAAAMHALLMWAAFPPINLWPLAALAPAPLAWIAIQARSTRFAVLLAFGIQIVLWAWISRWMVSVTAVGFPFYVMAMAAFNGGLFVWVFRRVHLRWDKLPMTLTLPIVWVMIEALRGEVIVNGYAWYFIAHPVVEAPIFAQSADLFGVYFISFLAAMVSGAALDVWRWRSGLSSARMAAGAAATAIVMLLANTAYGIWRTNQTSTLRPGPSLLVIQTNLPQDNKMRWTAEQQAEDLASFLQLTLDAHEAVTSEGGAVDLIVWPETMLPGYGLEPQALQHLQENGFSLPVDFAAAIMSVQQHLDVPMLVGSPAVLGLAMQKQPDGTFRASWSKQYNSAYLIEGQPRFQRYDKAFLTPFGETMPYISMWPALEEKLLAIGARGMSFDLDRTMELRVIRLGWQGRDIGLATPICFESTVGWLNRRLVYNQGRKRADVIVTITNDGWFGFHRAGRIQHAQISRYRAIENRVPVVRSANTGVSIAIDSAGRLIGAIGGRSYGVPEQSGSLFAQLTLDSRRTLYGTIGDLWAWLCIACGAALFAGSWLKKKGAVGQEKRRGNETQRRNDQ